MIQCIAQQTSRQLNEDPIARAHLLQQVRAAIDAGQQQQQQQQPQDAAGPMQQWEARRDQLLSQIRLVRGQSSCSGEQIVLPVLFCKCA